MPEPLPVRRRRDVGRRVALARIPERPIGVARIGPQLEAAREAGVEVEELDAQHVLLRYDARVREQWLAVDDLYDAAQSSATFEGVDRTEAAPDNWMAVHFDYGTCGRSFAPDGRR